MCLTVCWVGLGRTCKSAAGHSLCSHVTVKELIRVAQRAPGLTRAYVRYVTSSDVYVALCHVL